MDEDRPEEEQIASALAKNTRYDYCIRLPKDLGPVLTMLAAQHMRGELDYLCWIIEEHLKAHRDDKPNILPM